jgi:hypothetical protein
MNAYALTPDGNTRVTLLIMRVRISEIIYDAADLDQIGTCVKP